MTKKQRRPLVKTPRAVLFWPKLNKPDYGTEEFPKDVGEWIASIVVKKDSEAFRQIEQAVAPFHEEAVEEALNAASEMSKKDQRRLIDKNGPKMVAVHNWYKPVIDDEGEETGDVLIKIATKCQFKDRDTGSIKPVKPAIFDGRAQLITKLPQIGNGSEAKVSFSVRNYFIKGDGKAGVSLDLQAVQLLKLVEFGRRDASGYGFAADEDDPDAFDTNAYRAPDDDEDDDDGGEYGRGEAADDQQDDASRF